MDKLRPFFLAISFIATYFIFGAILSLFKPMFPSSFERYAQGILGTLAALIAVFIFLKIERKNLRDIGLIWQHRTLSRFIIGISSGTLIAGIMYLLQIVFSGLELTLNDDVKLLPFLLWSLAFIPLAFMEEIAFRSYPLLKLNEAYGFRITQFVLAISFVCYHILMGWSIGASFVGPGVWALAFGLSAIISKGIAVPTGLHFGLNFIQSLIGGQKGIEPIWNLDYPENASQSLIESNNIFGLILQLTVLIFCIVATEIYIRKVAK